MKIEYVPLEWVHRVWGAVESYIALAVEHSKGEYTLEQARAYVSHGQWLLLVATNEAGEIKGAATVNFFNRANERVACVTAIGGRLISSPDTFQQLKDFAVRMGATVLEGAARESIARLWKRYGFQEKYRIVEVKL